jgi:NADH-quinone oxidoreductase subunit F
VDLLLNVAKQMQGKCLCALGEFSTMAVVTGIERFPQDFKNAVSPSPLPLLNVKEREGMEKA